MDIGVGKAPVRGLAAAFALTLAASFFNRDLPTTTSTTFSGSGNCAVCHSPSSISPNALIDPSSGSDVSPPTLWRSTMMANAAKDPFWQAKVSAEVAANPQLKEIIEDKCTTCHAPTGRTEAASEGQPYSLAMMRADPLAMDGVTCTVCHQIKDEGLGTKESFSGKYVIENERLIYGPFDDQFGIPMNAATNYMPVYSEHVTRSELCATCHTLFTPFIDNSGEIAGELPEQVPYLEWKNSLYPEQDRQCQDCHMPVIEDEIPISAIPPNSAPRGPFWKHYFVGGNVTMLTLLRDNIDAIGVTAGEADFDSTISRTIRQLQDSTVSLSAEHFWMGDTLAIDVAVSNRAGHKLPTGFPSRRMWLRVTVRDEDDQVVFDSGEWDDHGRVSDADSTFEPHHAVIDSEDQVQIYESVMVDVDDEVTYTLLRGSRYIKDNRIPPVGFKMEHEDYPAASIEGAASLDSDFNWAGGVEGSGTDVVHYRIPGWPGHAGFTASIELLYQSLSPNWTDDLGQYDTEEVGTFEEYYASSDKSPVTLGSIMVSTVETAVLHEQPGSLAGVRMRAGYPNPFHDRTNLQVVVGEDIDFTVDVFDVQGRKVRRLFSGRAPAGSSLMSWDGKDDRGADLPAGHYVVHLVTAGGHESIVVQKVF